MTIDPQLILIHCSLLSLSGLVSLALAMRVLKKDLASQAPSQGLLPSGQTSQQQAELRPAELAYLLRPSDINHCLLVLFVDFLQKAIKNPSVLKKETASDSCLLAYELVVYAGVKDYLSDWSKQRLLETVPSISQLEPLKIAGYLWNLRTWFTSRFGIMLKDTIRDPLSLRQYFHPASVLRVLISLSAAKGKEELGSSLRTALMEKNLLLTDSEKAARSRQFVLIAVVQLAFILFTSCLLSGILGILWISPLSFLCALLSGVICQILVLIPSYLPFFDELARSIDTTERKGIRLMAFRIILRALRLFYGLSAALLMIALLCLQALALSWLLGFTALNFLLILSELVFLSGSTLVSVYLIYLCWRNSVCDQLSPKGRSLMLELRKELSRRSLISVLSSSLSSKDYDEKLSSVVAVYGIEALFLIA